MALTDPCKSREPRVIDNVLIQKCIDYQYPKGEVGRLMREEGIAMEEIQEIRIEYMNIIRIDHLWVMKGLTKLQLNNNYIEKIENIHMLVNLKELDLSFNRVSKIENLETLVNLEKLCLYDNLIEVIENMDTLKNLTILTIGKNLIRERENVLYLRKFKKLTSLNMAQNPCAEAADFRIYIAVFLPKVVYYEYKRLFETEREEGARKFETELRNLLRDEEEISAKIALIEKEKADAELHSVSFVEYLNTRHLFDSMFAEDVEGRALLEIGEDVQEFYEEFEQQFIDLCRQVFESGQKHYKIRQTEIEVYQKSVEVAIKENQNESIAHMDVFMQKKKVLFDQIKALNEKADNDLIDESDYFDKTDEISEKFNEIVHEVWKCLMKLELQLFEQLEEVNSNLERALTDMINTFTEESQALFSQIRALEVIFSENLGDAGGRYMTQAVITDYRGMPPSLKNIISDREALTNAIGASHDLHLQVIDNREDTLNSRAKGWLTNFVETLNKDEITRNRQKILEINHFLDIQREELEELILKPIVVVDMEDIEDFY
ncbi:unnamed protein product [Acanthoscelides obtectus]|uniref:Dynein axonemal assembly factor 1 homolog n=1 Tax=Acanthoscelides obtectus TaxID=200917 RepID=A0A9P0M040_ACAOB|nr:unnamed protein product [Acanthoscelides obtectus]CAK1630382.1 Dynein regulatory complex subunit 3 [Acanthoscelides obtectus]